VAPGPLTICIENSDFIDAESVTFDRDGGT
jgi:hypothetical protein